MHRARGKWQQVVIGLVALAVVAGAIAPAGAGEAVVLGRACVRDMLALLEKASKVAEKVVPGQGAQMTAAAAMMLQGAESAGIDWTKPVTVVLLSGKAFGRVEPAVVGIFPVTNGEQFRQARQAAGKANEHVEVRGNYALLSTKQAAFAAITERRINIYSKFPTAGGDADLYFTAYLDKIITEYQPEIDQAIQEAQERAAGMGPAAGPFAALASLQKVAGPLAKFAGKQARRVSLILKLTDESLDIQGRLYAVRDSQLAAAFAGQPAETTDLAKYLPRDAALSMVGKLDIEKLRGLIEAGLDTVAGPLEIKAEDREQILSIMFGTTQTGEFAAAYSGNPAHKGLQMAQVVRVRDIEKYRAVTKQAQDWILSGPLGGMMQGLGMQMDIKHEPGVREHKGVTIDRMTLVFKQDPKAPPNPMMPQQPPQVTEFSAFDTFGVAVTNNPTGDLLNGVIDRIKGGEPGLDQSPAYKATLAAAGEGASMVFHVSFNSMLAKLIEHVSAAQPMIAMMVGGIAKPDPNEAPITGYAKFGGDRVEFVTRVPQQPIINFATRVRAMIEQMRAGGGRPGPGPGPGPKPGDDDDF